MEDHSKNSNPSLFDDDPFFGYIPIGLDIKLEESFQNSSSLPMSEVASSYESSVDEAWNVDDDPLSILRSDFEPHSLEAGDSSSFQCLHESFSLRDEPEGFDEAFGSYCNLSEYDDLLSSPSKSTCEVERNNESSGRGPTSGVLSAGESSSKSSDEPGNACGVTKCNQSLSNQETPDIIITETHGDQDTSQPQALLHGMKTASFEQRGTSTKPFLDNPIRTHYSDSGKDVFLVRLSYNEVQAQMPEWFELYWEQIKLLEEASTLPGSRARLQKRKRET